MNLGGVGLPTMQADLSAISADRVEQEGLSDSSGDVATHFEAVFMSMMLKEMRATLSDGLFGQEGSDTFGALFDLHLGQHLADSGGIGLREMVAAAYAKNDVTKQEAAGLAAAALDTAKL
ncbi:MAG: rod-binding protein [Planctomycetales bacterium]|nr:rod-binding protein [Planctomycetales bacterium]